MSSHFAPPNATPSSYPSSHPSMHAYTHANPIDLTLDDDEDSASPYDDRRCKRPCTQSRSFEASNEPERATMTLDPSRHQPPYHSGLSPAMSSSSLDQRGYHSTAFDHPNGVHSVPAVPSSPSPFYQPQPSTNGHYYPATPPAASSSTSSRDPASTSQSRQVIDLTSSPSPPPSSQPPPPQSSMGNLPADLPPKTPVCIGQLTVTALILYPVPYLQAQGDGEWVPVRLGYEHNPNKPGGEETIHIKTPSMKTPAGEVLPGETFGVVEQKVAMTLGPMLGKGLIRLDAKVCRTKFHAPILSLQLLVYTPKGNITPVANYMQQNGLLLDHPTLSVDRERLAGQHYFNPHNPPPGGHARAIASAQGRMGYVGPGGNSMGRWGSGVSGKSVEVQRSQVEELFKSLKTGEELDETEPSPDVATTLYPHQKKALTFLLEREREYLGRSGKFSSLWQERRNPLTGERTWFHIVTQRETPQEPYEPRGSILADDMGLGKTITCVSLIAETVPSARQFGATPLPPLPPRPSPIPDAGLSAAHFQGSVWGMPEGGSSSTSMKAKQKAAREQERVDAEYARASRIKAKSRATLVICPLSTVVNWEDQFKEHWRGEVVIVGGGGACTPAQGGSGMAPPTFIMTPLSAPLPQPSLFFTQLQVEESKPVIQAPSTHTPGRVQQGAPLRVYVYHGNARRPDPTFLADFDVVITTYSTLASEFSKQVKSVQCAEDDDDDGGSDGDPDDPSRASSSKKAVKKRKKAMTVTNGVEATSPLQSVYWFRVVLDEAHSIKETSTVACRACCDLMADRRLCLTGTPVQNKLDDVYALIKFLRLSPLDDKNTWTEFIGTPVKYGQPLGIARIQTIMKCITLRRTKESRADDGQKILSLPPRRDEIRYLKFDEQEQSIYDQFFQESKDEFNELSDKNEVMKNYVGILQKILRLRQICDHYELVQNKGLGLIGDAQCPDSAATYEDVVATVSREGINAQRAATIFFLLKESGLTQCVECGYELAPQLEVPPGEGGATDVETPAAPRRGRKPKSRTSTRQNSPTSGHVFPVLTRCQHLFCIVCFRNSIHPNWPSVSSDQARCCSACQTALSPTDAVEVNAEQSSLETLFRKKTARKEKRIKGSASAADFRPSTKIRALLDDLQEFSKLNPHSANYDPNAVEIMMVDNQGNSLDNGIVKTVVFSQWTSMLDKIEDGLELARIRYSRLDGTMKREDRTRAMDALKNDPACEVLLVSLKAGGVGLNLTAAQRVYLIDPYWNPAVENQAVDRIHRLGQTRPVQTVKFIIENSIEARLLEVQRKKTELANMTLGQNFTKAEMLQRRMEELNQLFGG